MILVYFNVDVVNVEFVILYLSTYIVLSNFGTWNLEVVLEALRVEAVSKQALK